MVVVVVVVVMGAVASGCVVESSAVVDFRPRSRPRFSVSWAGDGGCGCTDTCCPLDALEYAAACSSVDDDDWVVTAGGGGGAGGGAGSVVDLRGLPLPRFGGRSSSGTMGVLRGRPRGRAVGMMAGTVDGSCEGASCDVDITAAAVVAVAVAGVTVALTSTSMMVSTVAGTCCSATASATASSAANDDLSRFRLAVVVAVVVEAGMLTPVILASSLSDRMNSARERGVEVSSNDASNVSHGLIG